MGGSQTPPPHTHTELQSLPAALTGASAQNARPASRASPRPRWCARRRTSSTTCTASPASSATGSWPRGTSSTSWRTGGWCARRTTRRPSRTVSFPPPLPRPDLCPGAARCPLLPGPGGLSLGGALLPWSPARWRPASSEKHPQISAGRFILHTPHPFAPAGFTDQVPVSESVLSPPLLGGLKNSQGPRAFRVGGSLPGVGLGGGAVSQWTLGLLICLGYWGSRVPPHSHASKASLSESTSVGPSQLLFQSTVLFPLSDLRLVEGRVSPFLASPEVPDAGSSARRVCALGGSNLPYNFPSTSPFPSPLRAIVQGLWQRPLQG